jgi:sulfide dehydrogenase [flavocytochrome c] flavoprotein chain
MQRRSFLKASALPVALASSPILAQTGGNVVVIGGGFGGATAAKYVRLFSPKTKVTLIEPNSEFISCPLSNRVLHGGMSLRDLTRPYDRFAAHHGIDWVRATADSVDVDKRIVMAGGQKFAYDRLIVSPGVEFLYDKLPGMQSLQAQQKIVHAWKAGEQTRTLRNQLTDLKPGGVIAMHIPKVPYKCPPGPYERASLLAYYLSLSNPRAKLMVFDSNPEIQSKKDLFTKVWASRYKSVIEYVPNAEIKSVDATSMTVDMDLHGKVHADVWNIIPPQRAGSIARKTGLVTVADKWCGVGFLSYESLAVKGVHVIGDAIAGSPGMPKSGHMANQEAKVCASAVAAVLAGEAPSTMPIIANTCYSFVSHSEVIHVAAVYRYDSDNKQMVAVKGAGGVSPEASGIESIYAMGWANNILNDTVG